LYANDNGPRAGSSGAVKEQKLPDEKVVKASENRKAEVSAEIAALKGCAAYIQLDPGPQKLAVYMLRRFANGSGSMCPGQGKTLAPRFKVCRQTINHWLRLIVDAEVFSVERRARRGAGVGRGRTSNVYRLNPACLDVYTTQDATLVATQNTTAESLSEKYEPTDQEPSTKELEPKGLGEIGVYTNASNTTANGSKVDAPLQTTVTPRAPRQHDHPARFTLARNTNESSLRCRLKKRMDKRQISRVHRLCSRFEGDE
jgi:hypothetical protein